jgi:hypothetical protein
MIIERGGISEPRLRRGIDLSQASPDLEADGSRVDEPITEIDHENDFENGGDRNLGLRTCGAIFPWHI